MNRDRMLRVPLLVILSVGCSQSPPAHDSAADLTAINQVRDREIAAFSSGQPDALVAVFTADALMLPPNEAQVKGHEALRSWAQGIAEQFTIAGRYTGSEVTLAGDWAIENYTGLLTLTPKKGGKPVEDRFKGLHIYKRQADGTWRIAYDTWNSEAPPPTAR